MYIYIRCFISNRRRRGLLRQHYTSENLIIKIPRYKCRLLVQTVVLDIALRGMFCFPYSDVASRERVYV